VAFQELKYFAIMRRLISFVTSLINIVTCLTKGENPILKREKISSGWVNKKELSNVSIWIY